MGVHGGPLRLGTITDSHVAGIGAADTYFNNRVHLGLSRALLTEALSWLTPRVDALLLLGDLTQSATPEEFRFVLDELDATELPCFVVPGNHDCPAPTDDGLLAGHLKGRERIRIPGKEPLGPALLTAGHLTRTAGGEYHNRLENPAPARLPVLLTHFPVLDLRPAIKDRGWQYAGDLTNRAELEKQLRAWPEPVLVLHGHLHTRAHAVAGNVLQLGMGALAEAPHDVALVSIDASPRGLRVTRECHQVLEVAPGTRPAVLSPESSSFTFTGRTWLSEVG
ncbi:metallophosphoesterase family protein [Amycolatopsis acidicola]|nr:metallophosphoesterase [Amycolatopsis acidicola]